jgi:hypothetical protein
LNAALHSTPAPKSKKRCPADATIAARADWPAGLTTALDELVKPETPLTPICHIQQRRVKRLVQRTG